MMAGYKRSVRERIDGRDELGNTVLHRFTKDVRSKRCETTSHIDSSVNSERIELQIR